MKQDKLIMFKQTKIICDITKQDCITYDSPCKNCEIAKPKIPKYAWCKLKNIAAINRKYLTTHDIYFELVNHLPNDCIRIKTPTDWCNYCNACGWKV